MTAPAPTREHWGSRFGFILAAAGSAIGLGNIWKFPYITYENGGGSFVLIYLACIALVGFPIMISEIIIGRRSQQSTVSGFLALSKNKWWALVGALGIASGFAILSFYSVVAGWTIYYFGECIGWSFGGFDETDLNAHFGAFVSNGTLQVLFHSIFMGVTIGVVAMGVKGGIERIAKTLMPILMGILVLLCLNSMQTEGFGEAMRFLFTPGEFTKDGALEALGHAFFTLSLGMGAMITYGSYMSKKDPIAGSAVLICILDTLIALMACVIMFSIIFSVEDKGQFTKSAAILFTTLPQLFYDLPFGNILSPIFYALVAMAALTSTISLLEVVTAFFIDQLNWHRVKAAITVGLVIYSIGILCALSNGANATLSSIQPLGDRSTGVFGLLDYLSANWMLPVGGLGIAIFVGWFLPSEASREELATEKGPFRTYGLWQFLVRFVCPAAIAAILVAVVLGRKFN